MSATPVPAPYKEKLYKDRNGDSYYTVVRCPCCRLQSRLLWPARLTSYPLGMFKFECYGCRQITPSTELGLRDICQIGCACEGYPVSLVVMV